MATAKKASPAPRKTSTLASKVPAPVKAPAKAPVKATAPAPAPAPAPAMKPVVAAMPAKPATPAKHAKAEKADKEKKPKLVRDSFTIPKAEYAVLQALKDRAARLGQPAKKSEVLRAGITALAGMADAEFTASLRAVPAIKTGRPAKA